MLNPFFDMDINETGFKVKYNLAGNDKKDLSLSVSPGEAVIKVCGRDFRRFEVSDFVDTEKVTAEYTNGILTITFPYKESHKPRSVEIK